MAENSHTQVAEIRHMLPRYHWQIMLLVVNSDSCILNTLGTKIAV